MSLDLDSRFFPGLILAIETSCDETSVAFVQGRRILSQLVASQVGLHQQWGGVVPEAAARAHVEAFLPLLDRLQADSGLAIGDCRAIAVTNRPGLVGALSVGVAAAKALGLALGVPVVPVHHLEGHLLSVYAEHDVACPHIALVASGGHTELVLVRDLGAYEIVGHTRDDAAGEAFDKSARLLGLGYPGGVAVEKASAGRNPRYKLPQGLSGDTLDFSFSGFKTAVQRLIEAEGERLDVGDAAASVQQAIVSVLTERTLRAAEQYRAQAVSLIGGVAANKALRRALAEGSDRIGVPFFTPSPILCTDNAGMIGIAGAYRLLKDGAGGDFDTLSSASLP